ncbi:MAG: flagellar basal body P-ring formation protein FlgA [Lysobacteraceae bacterium]|nr:MAG: flagellar basal body P-ring formation protein FlgA [Xanthomonadaceae bacterium]
MAAILNIVAWRLACIFSASFAAAPAASAEPSAAPNAGSIAGSIADHRIGAVARIENKRDIECEIKQEIELEIAREVGLRLRAAGSAARVSRIDSACVPAPAWGHVSIKIGAIAGRWPRRRAAVPVDLIVDARVVRRLIARVELSDPRPALIYAEAAMPHRIATELMLRPAMIDMTCCEGDAVASVDNLAGLRLRRARAAGQPVLRADFEPVPDVLRRRPIAIEARTGPVRIALAGVALTDGRIGEQITVLPAGARTAVRARVSAKQKVEIDVPSP